ncbi:MAG: flavin monoamine oxidase family protein [Acidobacteriota bacterium]
MAHVTRRTFLEATALAGAGVALEGCSALPGRPPYDAVVLGAGIAGLAAARDLNRSALDVLVLEGRDRVGGRMRTLHEQTPHGVELGAQMIHGSRASIWELVRELGIATRRLGRWERWIWSPGEGLLRPDTAREERAWRRVEEAYRARRGADTDYGTFLDALGLDEVGRTIAAENALSWSAEPEEMSLRAAIEDSAAWDAYQDDNFQVVGGFDALPGKLHEELGERVRLSCRVRSIEWGRRGVRVSCERPRGRTETIVARRAIVTFPVGILQSGRPAFEPDLPGWKRRAIDALRMGRVVVVHLLFRNRFWRDRAPGVPGWRSHGGRVSFWDPHPPGKGMPALGAYVQGRAAQELSDLGPGAGTDRVLAWIEEVFPRAGARRQLEWSAFAEWVGDPFSLGSYSITRLGGYGQRAVLATPIQDRLYFAGEATEPGPHYQTVHGAYTSGRRAAREILAALGLRAA